MDEFLLTLTREEKVGDRIEFAIKRNIPIRFVKTLLEAKLPYHPKQDTIKIFCNGELQEDDVMVYSLKEELENAAYLSFSDEKTYAEWISPSKLKISDELKQRILDNQPQRRFQVLVDRGDGEVERQINLQGRRAFVINLSLETIIVAGLAFYYFYYTQSYKSFQKYMTEKIGFSIPALVAWLLVTLGYILIPSIVDYVNKCNSNKKQRDMVDYTMNGILGDIWLCIYYFFATMLPFNWGPRVFRD